MAKKITIEKLAGMMQVGFKKVDQRFRESAVRIDKKIDDLAIRTDKKIDDLAVRTDKKIDDLAIRTDKKIDDLAVMVQKEFEDMQNRMATKEDLNHLATKNDLEILAQAIKDLEMHLSASLSHKQEEIDHLRNWMESIEARVAALEFKKSRKK